ncbi:uncharacterized protein LY89DRAFT_679901 [Mollisia scopiformis]|uniref:2EXR domain-containing protein n=1 Tax=Mollisia scopiformis TaxID=149040 RepID=A0A194XTR1_MOLSC|nr:uncharacterized protein LY89DRAFT_679901 [Mollisia scopiformis]KUJ23087.1 hypothetical protein LY89DRAFT_679901 [Mollisia scopiformis]
MDSFTLFPQLLPELRLLIWKYALLHPRLILIYKHATRTTPPHTHVRRTVISPLLSASRESRREALKHYIQPSLLPTTPTLFPPLNTQLPFPVGPGTDILYISGHDRPPRRRTPVTWTLTHLLSELDSCSPSFAPVRHLAIDLALLLYTPFSITPKFHIPYGIWKFVICDLRILETLIVVRSCGNCEEEKWGVDQVEGKLEQARRRFLDFWEGMRDGDDEEGGVAQEIERLSGWKMPFVEVLELEELVARCWV